MGFYFSFSCFFHTRLLLVFGYLLRLSYKSGPDIMGSKAVFQLVLTQVPKQIGTDNIRLVLLHVIQEWPSIWYQCGSFCISNLLQRNLLRHPNKILQNKKNWHFFILSRIPNSINTKRNHNFSRDFSSPNLDLDTLRIYLHIYIFIYVSLVELNFNAQEIIQKICIQQLWKVWPIWCVYFVFRGTKPKKLSTIKTCIWGSCNLELPGKWKLGSLLLLLPMQMQLLKLLRLARKPFCKAFSWLFLGLSSSKESRGGGVPSKFNIGTVVVAFSCSCCSSSSSVFCLHLQIRYM